MDAILEIFTWVGFGAAFLLGIAVVALWALDGTWLHAEAIVDHDGDETVVRWFDADGDANSAVPTPGEVAEIGAAEYVSIWYRHGWHGRMRLHRRPAGLRPLLLSTAGMLALGVLSAVAGVVMLFLRD